MRYENFFCPVQSKETNTHGLHPFCINNNKIFKFKVLIFLNCLLLILNARH